MAERRSFPLAVYVSIVFAVSWPTQIAAGLLVDRLLVGNPVARQALNVPALLMVPLGLPSLFHRQDAVCSLNAAALLMVAVGTLLVDRLVIRKGWADAGWHCGRPRHYAAVFGLVLLIWLVPCVAVATGRVSVSSEYNRLSLARLFVLGAATVFVAFGAEFGWRGYLLAKLLNRPSPRKAVLLHGIVWWAWYLPSTTAVAVRAAGIAGGQWRMPVWLSVPAVVALMAMATLVPLVLHAVILAFIRLRSGSLVVAAVYYGVFECVRDSVGTIKALDPLVVGVWANVVIGVIGVWLLWKANWRTPAPAAVHASRGPVLWPLARFFGAVNAAGRFEGINECWSGLHRIANERLTSDSGEPDLGTPQCMHQVFSPQHSSRSCSVPRWRPGRPFSVRAAQSPTAIIRS